MDRTANKLAMVQTSDPKEMQTAQALHSRVLGLKAELGRNAFAFGAALVEMRDHEHYRALGFPTFDDYLVSAAVGVARRTAYRFMRVYQRFGHVPHEAHSIALSDIQKLDILAAIIKEDEEPERILPLLDDAARMTRSQLRASVGKIKQQKLEATPERLPAPEPETEPADEAGEVFTYPTSDEPEWVMQATAAPYDAAPITAADLLTPVAALPTVPAPPPIYSLPTVPRAADDDDMSVRQYAIMTNYTHLVEDLLKVAHKHRQTIAEIDRRDIDPLRTAADQGREASLRPLFDWFAPEDEAYHQPLRRVK